MVLFIPMIAGQRKLEGQWTANERKAANLDQRLKSLIMSILPDDQMNYVRNCLTSKSTWDDLILYHEGPFYLFCERKLLSWDLKVVFTTPLKTIKSLVSATPLLTAFISTSIVLYFQDSPDDEEDTRSSHEYLNDLEEEYQARAFLAKSKRFFKKGTQSFSSAKATEQTECHKCGKKVKAKLALLSSSASASKAATINNKGLIAEAYEWDEEEVSSDDNEMVEVKILMALAEKMMLSTKKAPKMVNGLPNHDTGRILPAESQRNITDPSVAVTDSSATEYDSANKYSVCSTPLPPLKKLDSVEPISGPKTIKSILRSKSTFKAETLKGVIINEPSLAPVKGNKSSSASKVNSAPAFKLKSVKIKDYPPLAIVMKELNDLKLQISKNESSYSRNNQPQQRTDHRACDHVEYIATKNMSQHLKSLGISSLKPKNPRPSKHFFLPCIHCGFNDHLSDNCVNYPICDICGSYDHETHVHNRIISIRRGIKPRNPQHVMKSYETYGSTVHTTTDHNDIEWFRRGEEL
ncbi:hypothetical protein Tco_0959398 [Tanacetum coccineum]